MDLSQYTNEDYQNRNGNYPKSNIPVSITGSSKELEFSFKNTTEEKGISYVKNFCTQKDLTPIKIISGQDGDFHDDWITVIAKF